MDYIQRECINGLKHSRSDLPSESNRRDTVSTNDALMVMGSYKICACA